LTTASPSFTRRATIFPASGRRGRAPLPAPQRRGTRRHGARSGTSPPRKKTHTTPPSRTARRPGGRKHEGGLARAAAPTSCTGPGHRSRKRHRNILKAPMRRDRGSWRVSPPPPSPSRRTRRRRFEDLGGRRRHRGNLEPLQERRVHLARHHAADSRTRRRYERLGGHSENDGLGKRRRRGAARLLAGRPPAMILASIGS